MYLRGAWGEINRSSKLYLITRFLLAGFYTWPFWYGFAIEKISPSNFGVYIAVAYIVSLIAEIPTGAFADKFGRRKSALIGILFMSIYGFIVFFGRSFEFYLISTLFSGVGSAFISGSLEALVFESEGMTKQLFRKVTNMESIFWQSGLIVSAALGGMLFSIHKFLPFVAQGLSFIVAFFVVLKIKEHTSQQSKPKKVSLRTYIYANKEGFLHLFEKKVLRPIIIFGAVLSSAVWVGIENLNEASMIYYGYNPEIRGFLLSGTKILVVILLSFIVFKKVKSDMSKLLYLYIVLSTAFVLYAIGDKMFFVLGFIFFNLVSSTMDNFIKPILHDEIDNKFRATAISTYSFVTNICVAMIAVLVGVFLQETTPINVQKGVSIVVIIICGWSLYRYARLRKTTGYTSRD